MHKHENVKQVNALASVKICVYNSKGTLRIAGPSVGQQADQCRCNTNI